MSARGASICLLWLAACTSGPDPDPGTDTPCEPAITEDLCPEAATYSPTLELGTGELAFTEIAPEDILVPAWGPQGGQHIWATIRTTGLNPGVACSTDINQPVEALITLDFPEHEEGPYSFTQELYLTGPPENAEQLGITAFVCVYDIAWAHQELLSIPATLSVSATDSCGTTVSDSREFLMDLSEYNGED
jgi:hypothetical protein